MVGFFHPRTGLPHRQLAGRPEADSCCGKHRDLLSTFDLEISAIPAGERAVRFYKQALAIRELQGLRFENRISGESVRSGSPSLIIDFSSIKTGTALRLTLYQTNDGLLCALEGDATGAYKLCYSLNDPAILTRIEFDASAASFAFMQEACTISTKTTSAQEIGEQALLL